MVIEIAQIEVTPGSETQFEAGYDSVRQLIADFPGSLSMRMTRGIESPSRFILMIEWESVTAHDAFRASPSFAQWRAGIGPFFAGPPNVEHYADLELADTA
jgi:heme-degrading monooxygenase HmoA